MSCVSGDAQNCDKTGLYYLNHKYGARYDVSKSMYYFMKSCQMKNADGCFHLAQLYDKGKHIKKDSFNSSYYYHKAFVIYQDKCKHNHANSCLRLGLMYAESNGITKNMQKAKQLFYKSCQLKNQDACSLINILDKKRQFIIK
jgi:TPR repeat protein